MYAMLIGHLPFTTPYTDHYRRQKLVQQMEKGLTDSHSNDMAILSQGKNTPLYPSPYTHTHTHRYTHANTLASCSKSTFFTSNIVLIGLLIFTTVINKNCYILEHKTGKSMQLVCYMIIHSHHNAKIVYSMGGILQASKVWKF